MTTMQHITYALSQSRACLDGRKADALDYLSIALDYARSLPATPKHRALRAHIVSAIEALS